MQCHMVFNVCAVVGDMLHKLESCGCVVDSVLIYKKQEYNEGYLESCCYGIKGRCNKSDHFAAPSCGFASSSTSSSHSSLLTPLSWLFAEGPAAGGSASSSLSSSNAAGSASG